METIKIGSHTLIHGDSYELIDTIKADVLITDPPYEFETSGGGRFRRSRTNMDEIVAAGIDKGFDFSIIDPARFSSAFVFCHNDQLAKLLPHMDSKYHRTALCAWHKLNPMPVANCHYQPDTEYYIHSWEKGFYPTGRLEDKKRYVICNNGQDTDIDHPTVKPLPLMEKIMINASGKTIFDPFMGSGTTGIAAHRHGKDFIGIEINRKFFDIAVRRMTEECNQGNLFEASHESI